MIIEVFRRRSRDTDMIVMIVRYSNLTPKRITFVVSKTLYSMNRIGSEGITPQFPFLAYPIYCGYHAWCCFLPELFLLPHTVLRPFRAVPVTTHCVTSSQSCPTYHTLGYVLPELSLLPYTVLRPFRAVPVTTHCVTSFQSCPTYHTLGYVLSELSHLPHTVLCPFRAVPPTIHRVMSFQSCPTYHTLCYVLSELSHLPYTGLHPFRTTPVITPCYFL